MKSNLKDSHWLKAAMIIGKLLHSKTSSSHCSIVMHFKIRLWIPTHVLEHERCFERFSLNFPVFGMMRLEIYLERSLNQRLTCLIPQSVVYSLTLSKRTVFEPELVGNNSTRSSTTSTLMYLRSVVPASVRGS